MHEPNEEVPQMKSKVFSKEQKKAIVNECIEESVSPNALALKYKVHPQKILSWFKAQNKKLPKVYKVDKHFKHFEIHLLSMNQ